MQFCTVLGLQIFPEVQKEAVKNQLIFYSLFAFFIGDRKNFGINKPKPLPDGVHRYAEQRGFYMARKGKIIFLIFLP